MCVVTEPTSCVQSPRPIITTGLLYLAPPPPQGCPPGVSTARGSPTAKPAVLAAGPSVILAVDPLAPSPPASREPALPQTVSTPRQFSHLGLTASRLCWAPTVLWFSLFDTQEFVEHLPYASNCAMILGCKMGKTASSPISNQKLFRNFSKFKSTAHFHYISLSLISPKTLTSLASASSKPVHSTWNLCVCQGSPET